MNNELNQTASVETEEEYDYYNIPERYKVSILDRLSLEQSQFDWPKCVNEIHVFDLRHLRAMEEEDPDSIWEILIDLNNMSDDGTILYRRGQGFITWVVINEEAYKASCKVEGLRFETDPHYRKIKNLDIGV
jgi:hypothetical protein